MAVWGVSAAAAAATREGAEDEGARGFPRDDRRWLSSCAGLVTLSLSLSLSLLLSVFLLACEACEDAPFAEERTGRP